MAEPICTEFDVALAEPEPDKISVILASMACERDQETAVPLTIVNGAGVTGILAVVTYPIERFTCNAIRVAGPDTEKTLLYRIDDDIGKATILIVPTQPFGNVAGDDVMAELGMIPSPDQMEVSANVSVSGTASTGAFGTDALVETTAILTIPGLRRGDLNSDGVVDQNDIAIMAQILLGAIDPAPYLEFGDFNGDGVIDIADFAKLVAYVRGEVIEL